MQKRPKIVIRTPNWLGDLMMALPFIQRVLEVYPQSRVDLIVKKGFEGLPLPHRGEIIPYDKAQSSPIAFGLSLRSRSYDLHFVLPPSFSAAVLAFCAGIGGSGAGLRVGYRGNFRSLFLRPALRPAHPPRGQHLALEYLGLLAEVSAHPKGGEVWLTKAAHCKLAVTKKSMAAYPGVAPFELPSEYIALAPGAIYGAAKRWPIEYFLQFGQEMQRRTGFLIVIVGTQDDMAVGQQIADGIPEALNLCGHTTLHQLMILLWQTKLLLSNDSGAMHIRASLGGPQVAIFGSTSPRWTAPLNPQARVLQLQIDCSPCFERTCRFGHYQCLQQLTPEQAVEAAMELLTEESAAQ